MKKQVLIIDDTKNIRILLTKCLELEGYAVKAATNGKEGLDLLLDFTFDLIFLDIKLPEMSGTEVLRRIRTAKIYTPVIIITAYPTIKNAVECTQLGAIHYLQKPFTADRLHSVLTQLHLEDSPTSGTDETDEIQTALDHNEAHKAIVLLKEVLSKDPTNAKTYFLLSDAYKKLGDDDNSNKFLETGKIFSKGTIQ